MTSRIDRRGFLKQSAAFSTLAMSSSGAIVSAEAETAPRPATRGAYKASEQVRVAVIGIRGQGTQHIRWHAAVKNVRVVTICDVDETLFADRIKLAGQKPPKTETDLRCVLDDKDIDVVSIATPNHWHALATIWACQAGKDVYVEKPGSHNIREGRKMVEAAHKYDRIVQHGTQMRASAGLREAFKLLCEKVIGDVYMARAYIYRRRRSIGVYPDEPSPPNGVHYDLWLGPAPVRPFNKNRFHYEWHWYWDYGNGEMGNNGVHVADVAIQGLDKPQTHPVRIHSLGGRFAFDDQGQTPNTQMANFQYADGTILALEIRNLDSNDEGIGSAAVVFYGSRGYLITSGQSFRTVIDGKPGPQGSGGGAHPELINNFHQVVRNRKASELLAPIDSGHYAATLCHLANISYRLGRSLEFDPKAETFPNDPQANALLTREYRRPFVVPDVV